MEERTYRNVQNLVQKVNEAFVTIHENINNEDVKKWLLMYQKVSTLFRQLLKHKKLSSQCKRKIHHQIVKLKTSRALLIHKIEPTSGEGYASTSNETRSTVEWQDVESAFKNRLLTGVIVNLTKQDLSSFLKNSKAIIHLKFSNIIESFIHVKVNCTLLATFVLHEVTEQKYFHTVNQILQGLSDLNQWYDDICSAMATQIEEFQERDSSWALKTIDSLLININKYSPMLGSSYIDLPSDVRQKKAVINVRNNDNACFAWACVSALVKVKHNPQRVDNYPCYKTVLNFDRLCFPIELKHIPKFESLNNLRIHVYLTMG